MGEFLSVDFANTAEWHAGSEPVERLTSYGAVLDWAREHGVLTDAQAEALRIAARERPQAEAQALARVIALRETIYRTFAAVAHRHEPDPDDLRLLDAVSREAAAHLQLVVAAADDGAGGSAPAGKRASPAGALPRFGWAWLGMEDDLISLLWPVARDAVELLMSGELVQLRQCAGDPCGWLFLDRSKNASRRWCDMADCGNRAKARRYRERKKVGAAIPAALGAESAGRGAV